MLFERNIPIRGVVVNKINDNCSTTELTSITRIIEEYTNTKIIGLLPDLGEKFTAGDLISAIINGIDIESVFDMKIAKLDV